VADNFMHLFFVAQPLQHDLDLVPAGDADDLFWQPGCIFALVHAFRHLPFRLIQRFFSGFFLTIYCF